MVQGWRSFVVERLQQQPICQRYFHRGPMDLVAGLVELSRQPFLTEVLVELVRYPSVLLADSVHEPPLEDSDLYADHRTSF